MTDTLIQPSIQDVIDGVVRALRAKDVQAVTAHHAPGFIQFSLAPPLQHGSDAGGLQAWFDTWNGPIGYEVRDLKVTAGDDVAFATALAHMSGAKHDGEVADLWFRLTLGLMRGPGGWAVAHEHESVPFHMDGSFRAATDLKP